MLYYDGARAWYRWDAWWTYGRTVLRTIWKVWSVQENEQVQKSGGRKLIGQPAKLDLPKTWLLNWCLPVCVCACVSALTFCFYARNILPKDSHLKTGLISSTSNNISHINKPSLILSWIIISKLNRNLATTPLPVGRQQQMLNVHSHSCIDNQLLNFQVMLIL